ncbi:MAG: signal peptidase II [bacterium]|nr:signal peptidase II [bacterium]
MGLAYGIAGIIVIVDQLTKWKIVSNIALHDEITIIPGLLRLTYVKNSGAAFGLFPGRATVFVISALLIIALIILLRQEIVREGKLAIVASGLLLGGAVGNLIDRLRGGYVVDFIGVFSWPIFNVADMSVVAAAILMVLVVFTSEGAPW